MFFLQSAVQIGGVCVTIYFKNIILEKHLLMKITIGFSKKITFLELKNLVFHYINIILVGVHVGYTKIRKGKLNITVNGRPIV